MIKTRRVLWVVLWLLASAVAAHGQRRVDVRVESTPSGAQVFDQTYSPGRVDGFMGVTPFKTRLDPRTSHDVYFVLAGYATTKARLRIGETHLAVRLSPSSLGAYLRRYTPWLLLGTALMAFAFWRLRRRTQQLEHALVLSEIGGTDLVGRVVDGYRVVAHLGDGAFSEVYRAEHVEYGDAFALKVLRRDVLCQPASSRNSERREGEETLRERFAREMAVGRDLHHPGLVPVYGFGVLDDGRPWMAMELLHGVTLQTRLREGPLSVQQALDVLLAVTDALAYTHARGVIHRDLKPENIMLERDGGVRVLDFGIARWLDRARITVSNAALGTPLYMSPEHLSASLIDERSDVYSLGVIAYEMLDGHAPFHDQGTFAVLAGHLAGSFPVLDERRVPAALMRIVARMLAREKADRFASMQELHDVLRQVAVCPDRSARTA